MNRSNIGSSRDQILAGQSENSSDGAHRRRTHQGNVGEWDGFASSRLVQVKGSHGKRYVGLRHPHIEVVMEAQRIGERPRPRVFLWLPGKGTGR